MNKERRLTIQHFFDSETSTLTYLVYDDSSKDAVIIDPVLDFDPPSGVVDDRSAQLLLLKVKELGLKVHYILETHAHADHLSSSQLLKSYFPEAKVAISCRITQVQEVFKKIFNLPLQKVDGSDFDFLFRDEEQFHAGSLLIRAIPTPGHTPACSSFLIGDALFSGDALFLPDYGTGRCDFPGGSATLLFDSVKTLYLLPDSTRVFVGHDYQPNGRPMACETTIGESKKNNIQLKAQTTQEDYVQFREARDKTLKAPRLLLPSLQINIAAGHLPAPEENGSAYLKLPLKPKFKKES